MAPGPFEFTRARRFGTRGVDFREQFSDVIPERGVARLAGGTLIAPGGWVFDNEARLRTELSWFGDDTSGAGTLPALPEKAEHLDGHVLSLGTNWGQAYGHLLPEGLGRLAVFERAGFTLDDVDTVLVPSLKDAPQARSVLSRLGIPEQKTTFSTWGRAYSADELFVPTLTGLRRQYVPALYDLYRRCLPVPVEASRRLFVTRAGFGRNPHDREAVEDLAESLGFEIYDPMKATDQAVDFHEAKSIVGVSGTALTNLLFCQPGTRVLEIFSSAHVFGYYYSMAGAGDLDYAYIVGNADEPTKNVGRNTVDFELSVADLEEALRWAAE